jgi:hypothetical protein
VVSTVVVEALVIEEGVSRDVVFLRDGKRENGTEEKKVSSRFFTGEVRRPLCATVFV